MELEFFLKKRKGRYLVYIYIQDIYFLIESEGDERVD